MEHFISRRVACWSIAVLLCAAAVNAGPAFARVSCSHGPVRVAFDNATAVFIGQVQAPPTVVEPLASGFRGIPDMHHQIVVQQVFKGEISPGDTLDLHWHGYAEPIDGPIVGGCRIPGMQENHAFPFQVVVFAQQNEDGAYVVMNRSKSSSFRSSRHGRRLLRQLRTLGRRLNP